MYSYKIIVKNEDTGETREEKRVFETTLELENSTANDSGDMAYKLYLQAEQEIFEEKEDDGDTYNGDTTNDINA